MKKLIFFFLFPLFISAQENNSGQYERVPPQEIEVELEDADAQYKRALEIFNPWYTGPLLTPGASMMPVGQGNTQPYLFFIDNYATFNSKRKSVSLPNNLLQLKGTANIQTGITDNLDFNVTCSAISNWQNGSNGGGFQDMNATAGLLIFTQTPYIPQFKFTITQTFPTGKYKNLNTNGLGLDATGGGVYSTQFGFVVSKVLFWATQHPMNVRAFVGYQIATTAHVKNFHAYGGGFGTRGVIRPGNILSADFGYELSITQRWVFAIDLVYSATNQTKFHGIPGTLANGTPASNGSGFSDNLSLSPAIEYNFNPNLGLIAGGWFSVYGRNSFNYGSGIISLTYSFP